MFVNLNDIAILKIKHADYICFIGGIRKSEAIKLLHNIDLTEKGFKYFIVYRDAAKRRSFSMFFPKMSAYRKKL